MKSWNSHIFTLKNLQYFPRFPKAPKVVLFGTPNAESKMFAHRYLTFYIQISNGYWSSSRFVKEYLQDNPS